MVINYLPTEQMGIQGLDDQSGLAKDKLKVITLDLCLVTPNIGKKFRADTSKTKI